MDVDDILALLEPTFENPDGAVRVIDICQKTGQSAHLVRVQLRPLVEDGTLQPVPYKIRRLDGRMTTVPAYKLTRRKHE